MCRNKMKQNHVCPFNPRILCSFLLEIHDFSSFYFDTFPLILAFYAAFYWRIYLCFRHFYSFAATDLLTLSLFTVVHLAGHNRQWIDTDTIGYAGYR